MTLLEHYQQNKEVIDIIHEYIISGKVSKISDNWKMELQRDFLRC